MNGDMLRCDSGGSRRNILKLEGHDIDGTRKICKRFKVIVSTLHFARTGLATRCWSYIRAVTHNVVAHTNRRLSRHPAELTIT
jgi:hypothetical protein